MVQYLVPENGSISQTPSISVHHTHSFLRCTGWFHGCQKCQTEMPAARSKVPYKVHDSVGRLNFCTLLHPPSEKRLGRGRRAPSKLNVPARIRYNTEQVPKSVSTSPVIIVLPREQRKGEIGSGSGFKPLLSQQPRRAGIENTTDTGWSFLS